jgi:hypothetical protein
MMVQAKQRVHCSGSSRVERFKYRQSA